MRIGPFELVEQVGTGGSAQVWRGEHTPSGSDVAVKFLHRDAFAENGRQQFVLEVQTIARLWHPAVVSVFDYGTLESDLSPDDELVEGIPYLVMEYSQLGELDARQVPSWDALRSVLLQVLDALAYAHARSVIHRDIKPENILRFETPDGDSRLKLSDFGIAQALEPESERLDGTRLATSAGTPHYMPPEQLLGRWRTFGPWTDLYALGCTAWKLACGTPPFVRNNIAQMAIAHLQAPLPSLEPQFGVPDGFERWLRTMLAKEPHLRFGCAADAAAGLLALGEPEPSGISEETEDADPSIEHDADTLISATVRLNTLPMDTPVPGVDTPSFPTPTTHDGQRISGELDERAVSEVTQLAARSAPGPDEWKRATGRGTAARAVRAVGLSLFSLRETPLVGRDDACEHIWQKLRDVYDEQGFNGFLVRGDAGTGKTRLIHEMARRADELGAATVLRATHSRLGGPTDGLGRTLERYFVAWGLDTDDCIERVRTVLRQQAPELDDEFLDEEARRLVRMMRAAQEDGGNGELLRPDARYAAMSRLVERAARYRPVVIWLDDLQWATDSLEWLEFMQREHADVPALVLGTVLEDFSDSPVGTRQRIDALGSLEGWRQLRLERLETDEHRTMIDSLLPFAPELAERLTTCTGGEPLFAFQLVSDLVDSGCLHGSAQGYRLDEAYTLPESMDDLWRERLERVLGPLDGDGAGDPEVEQAWIALELAAALGTRVVDHEWQAVCRGAGVPAAEPLLERLGRAGMVEISEDGWAFVHQTLATTLRATAEEAGRSTSHHRICSEQLQQIYIDADRWQLGRIAEHAFQGGAAESAAEMLLEAAEALVFSNELQEAERLLEMRSAALDQLGAEPNSRPRILNDLLSAQVDRAAGRNEAARERLTQIVDLAEDQGWHAELIEALREMGELHAQNGRLQKAREYYERGLEHARRMDARHSLARLLSAQGWIYKQLGRFEEAHDVLERARELYAELGDEVSEVGILNPIGFTWLAEGNLQRARTVCRDGIQMARDIGHRSAEAGFWTTLGEIERFEGRWDEARRSYSEAERLDTICGSKHAYLVRFNRLLAEVGAGHYGSTRDALADLRPALERIGYAGLLSVSIELIQVCCAAGLTDWDEALERAESAVAALEEHPMVSRDVAWLAEHAGAIAARSGQRELRDLMLGMARDQWRELDEQDALERVDTLAANDAPAG